MDQFFVKLAEIMPSGGGLRMVITRNGDEILVTAEIRKDPEAGWSSPVIGRGHFANLGEPFFKELFAGINTVKAVLVDGSKVTPPAEEKPKAQPSTRKTPAKTVETPVAPVVQKESELFGAGTSEKPAEPVPPIVEQKPEPAAAAAPPPPPPTPPADDDFGAPSVNRDALLEEAKNFVRNEDFVGAVKVLETLDKAFPNDAYIMEKLAKFKAKLPPPPVTPPEDDF